MCVNKNNLWVRFAAGSIDIFIIEVVSTAARFIAQGGPFQFRAWTMSDSSNLWIWLSCEFGLTVLYFAILEGLWGATLGKALLNLRVHNRAPCPPGLYQGLVRGLLFVSLLRLPNWSLTGGDPDALLNIQIGPKLLDALQPVLIPALFLLFVLFKYSGPGLLFVSMRRANGFAAVHDVLTGSQVSHRPPVLDLSPSTTTGFPFAASRHPQEVRAFPA